MAYEELEAIPRGIETPNIYGPADKALTVDESCMVGSARNGDNYISKTPEVYTQQPQGQFQIDWSNPLTYRLADCYVGGHRNNLVTGELDTQKFVTASDNIVYSNSISGTVYSDYHDTNYQTIFVSTIFLSNTSNYPVSVQYGYWNSNADCHVIGLQQSPSPNVILCNNYTNNGAGSVLDTVTYPSIRTYSLRFGMQTNTDLEIWWGNQQQKIEVRSGNLTVPSKDTRRKLSVGSENSSANSLVLRFSRRLSNAEIILLNKNIWQIFKKPIARNIVIPKTPILPSKVGIPGLPESSKRPWTSQPQQEVEIDSLIKPVLAFNFSQGISPKNLANKQLSWAHSGTLPNVATSIGGIGASTGAAASSWSSYGIQRSFDGFSPANSPAVFVFSFVGGQYVNNGSSANIIWSYGQLDSSVGFCSSVNSSNVLKVRLCNTEINGPTLVSGKLYNCVAGRDSSGSCWLWVNGSLVSSGSGATAADSATAKALQILGDDTGVRAFSGQLLMFCMGSANPLPFGAQLSQNPWQIFKPLAYKQFVGQNTLPNIQVYRDKVAVRRSSQPQIPVEIDWSNPLSKGLLAFVDAGVDVVSKKIYNPTISSIGTCGKQVGIVKVPIILDTSKPIITFIKGIKTFNSMYTYYISISQGSTEIDTSFVRITGSGFGGLYIDSVEKFGSRSYVHEYDLIIKHDVTRSTLTYIVMYAGSVIHRAHETGVSINVPSYVTSGDTKLYLVYEPHWGGTGKYFSTGGVFNDDMTLQQMEAFIQNPWQIFKPISRRIENRTPVKPQPLLPRNIQATQSAHFRDSLYCPYSENYAVLCCTEPGIPFTIKPTGKEYIHDISGFGNTGYQNILTQHGKAIKFLGGSYSKSFEIKQKSTNDYYQNRLVTYFIVFNVSATTGISGRLGCGSGSGGPVNGNFYLNSTGYISFSHHNVSSSDGGLPPVKLGKNVLSWTINQFTGECVPYLNGIIGTKKTGYTNYPYSSHSLMYIGAVTSGNLAFYTGAIIDRILSQREIIEISNAPELLLMSNNIRARLK